MILAALAYALSDGIDPEWRSRVTIAPHSWPGFGLALILVMGAYDGWQWVPQLAGELKNPTRALPRALGGGVLIVVAVYLATNASVLVLSPHDVTTSSLVTADVARHVLGAAGGALVAALMAVSTFGSNQSGMMTDPRVFFAMAQDGLFFRSVGAIHPRHRTPHVAVALIGVGGILYLYIRNFEELVGTLILGMWPFLRSRLPPSSFSGGEIPLARGPTACRSIRPFRCSSSRLAWASSPIRIASNRASRS